MTTSSYDFLNNPTRKTRSKPDLRDQVGENIYDVAELENKMSNDLKDKYINYSSRNQRTYVDQLIKPLGSKFKGFLRIVSQNMHCRQDVGFTWGNTASGVVGAVGLGVSPCIGTACAGIIKWGTKYSGYDIGTECKQTINFKDNQIERARGFAKLIRTGKTKADIIAIQELQHAGALAAFREELAIQIPPHPYKIIEKTCYGAVFCYDYIPNWIKTGQFFVYNKDHVIADNTVVINFPASYSSGIDAGAYGKSATAVSFKGIVYSRFQIIKNGKFIWVFNIHPSPWLNNVGQNDKFDTNILTSHLVQTQLVAEKIRELQLNDEYKNDTFITCGDFNINKYVANGVKYNDTPDFLKNYFGIANYKNLYTKEQITDKMDDEYSGATTRFTINKSEIKGEESMYLDDTGTSGESKISPSYCGKTNIINKLIIEKGGIPFFKPIKQPYSCNDPCFRDDVPFISTTCHDTTLCGSEYSTIMEILESCPPIHLKSICEENDEISPPFNGKYTWDSYQNSVLSSPLWDEPAFQLIDHIVYSKRGNIPLYAHTMTKRFLLPEPVEVNEGPLSVKCRKSKYSKKNLNTAAQRYYVKPNPDNIPSDLDQQLDIPLVYVDIADHYAVECILIIDDINAENIDTLYKTIKIPLKKLEFFDDCYTYTKKILPYAEYYRILDNPDKTSIEKFKNMYFTMSMLPKIWKYLVATPNSAYYEKFLTTLKPILDGEKYIKSIRYELHVSHKQLFSGLIIYY